MCCAIVVHVAALDPADRAKVRGRLLEYVLSRSKRIGPLAAYPYISLAATSSRVYDRRGSGTIELTCFPFAVLVDYVGRIPVIIVRIIPAHRPHNPKIRDEPGRLCPVSRHSPTCGQPTPNTGRLRPPPPIFIETGEGPLDPFARRSFLRTGPNNSGNLPRAVKLKWPCGLTARIGSRLLVGDSVALVVLRPAWICALRGGRYACDRR